MRPCAINRPARAAFAACASLVKFRRNWAAALALGLAAPLLAAAQGTPVPARVADRVDVSRMTTLKGNMHALAQAKYDQGAAPPDLPMNRMMLLLKRSTDQESALQDLLVQQQITSSATFHKWLTPDQFGQQFGAADADIQSVTSWLASFGFQSIKVSKGRNVIEFSGTASQVETALHTSIHKYVVNGENHWANSGDPQVPAALAPVISGFASLHDFHPRTTMAKLNRNVAGTVTSGPKPQINLSGGRHALVPADFNKIYNIGSSMTGSGVTIGIIASSNINVQDVADFRTMWGLSSSNLPTIIANGPLPDVVPQSGGEGEAVLDATWAGAVAPAATVDLVVSEDTNAANGTDLSEFYIVDNNLADVMTESFQSCESQFANAGVLFGPNGAMAFYGGMAEQAAAQGITFLVSSGDGGPDACDDPSTEPATITSPSVNLLAATPFNVAVGGTEFHDCNPLVACEDTAGTYWQSANGTNSVSAKGYIPENVWNESCVAALSGQPGCSQSGLWSSGGGASIAFLTAPPWQAGVTGLPANHPRLVPDVAMNAADHDGYILCIDGSCQGIGCPPPGTGPCFGVASGTSASVQVFGGVMALVVQQLRAGAQGPTARIGIANYTLYKLAGQETYATCNGSAVPSQGTLSTCVFNDETVGKTDVPKLAGFSAVAGYDETTGLGSVNVTNLVTNWSNAISEGSTTILALSTSPATNPVTLIHGHSASVNITVAPTTSGAGTPSGDVSLIASSNTDSGVDFFTLSSGSVSSNTFLLPGGTYQVHAHYEGDKTFLGSDSTPVSVTVTREASQLNFGIVVSSAASSCTASSVVYGSRYVLTVDVSDLNAVPASTPCSPNVSGSSPTGTVTLSESAIGAGSANGSFKLNSFGFFEDQTIQLTAGSHTITATYSGDNSFSPPTSPTTGVITVTKAATVTTVAASPTTVPTGTAVTLTATIAAPQSNAFASASQEPTGTVQFFVNGTPLPGPVNVTGVLGSNITFAQSTVTMSTSTLPAGQDVITAQYSGDNNYIGSSTVTSATVAVGVAGINESTGCGANISITAPGQSGSCLITVTGSGGFAGTVALSVVSSTTPPSAVDVPTCSFGAPSQNFTAPSTITLSSGSQTGNATLTCSSQAASHVLFRPSGRPFRTGWPAAGAAISLAIFLFFLSASRPRRWGFVPLAVLLFVVAAAVVSCGGGSGGGGGGGSNPGTTIGTYTFTVTATPSGGTAVPTTITVNVQ